MTPRRPVGPDLPPDPDNKNDSRAAWAASTLRHFQSLTGSDDETALVDLLTDFLHWCDRNDTDFHLQLLLARTHYDAETAAVPEF